MLDVWRSIVGELVEHDALLVLGKGLGAFEITARFLAIHAAPSSLVLLINAPKSVQARLELRHRAEGYTRPTAAINNEYSGTERDELYNAGGVIAVTSRILAVDFLTDRVPADKVTGLVVWDAHRVSETSSEAFILRLFRQKNKVGFIKGISDSADSFSAGFFKVEKVMKSLFVKKLFLWPRFHVTVAECLNSNDIDLVELKQAMTPSLLGLQSAIVDAMDACLVEIRKSNRVDLSELTMETALLAAFDAVVRRQLMPVWNKVGAKTKQLVEDLKTLRKLLAFVADYDCVTFLDLLDNLARSAINTDTGHAPFWMYMGAGRRLLDLAKARVFEAVDVDDDAEAHAHDAGGRSVRASKALHLRPEIGQDIVYRGKRLRVKLEKNPKWTLLRDVMEEIEATRAEVARAQSAEAGQSVSLGPTLVIVRDERTASQARDVLTYDVAACLSHAFRRYCHKRLDALRQQRPHAAGNAGKGRSGRPGGEQWWLERDEGMDLNNAQIESRLLATRALKGVWQDLPEKDHVVTPAGPAGAACSRASVCAVDNKSDNIEEDGQKLGAKVLGKKRMLHRMTEDAAQDESDDNETLAAKEQRMRAANEFLRSSSGSCAGSAASSDSDDSEVSCPSPFAAAAQRARSQNGLGENRAAANASSDHQDLGRRPAKKTCVLETSQAAHACNFAPSVAVLRQAENRGGSEGIIGQGDVTADLKEHCGMQDNSKQWLNDDSSEEKMLEATHAVLGLTRDMLRKWITADLKAFRDHLVGQDTGDLGNGEVARQGLLESFLVAVEMWQPGAPHGGFASFLEEWQASVPMGLSHVIAHVSSDLAAFQGLESEHSDSDVASEVKQLLMRMRRLYELNLPLALCEITEEEDGAAHEKDSLKRSSAKGAGEKEEKSAVSVARAGTRSRRKLAVAQEEEQGKTSSGRGAGGKGKAAATKVVRGMVTDGGQARVDPHSATRQTIKHTSDVDRIFEEQCLFVSPLYAADAAHSQTRVGGATTETNRSEMREKLYNVLPENSLVIHTTEDVDAVLHELRPSFVVVLSPDVSVTRLLEVYKTQTPTANLRVYYLSYEQSVEEQRYLSEVRRETEAFKSLIENKARMVVPETQDGKSGDVITVAPDAPLPTSTRRGGAGPVRRSKVIVDVREFRSALPSLLHQRGMTLLPVTLEVGDYILSPSICVERKSIPDLISSFSSGRLFQQAENMTRYYKIAVLLIEFDENRSFGLQSVSALGQDIAAGSVISKLVLLTLHFPTLRILWMRSPYMTALMFDELKQNQMEPDAAEAERVGQDTADAKSQFSIVPQDILRKLPGINANNVTFVMNHVESLHALSTMSMDELTKLIGAANAKQLHEFLHARGPCAL